MTLHYRWLWQEHPGGPAAQLPAADQPLRWCLWVDERQANTGRLMLAATPLPFNMLTTSCFESHCMNHLWYIWHKWTKWRCCMTLTQSCNFSFPFFFSNRSTFSSNLYEKGFPLTDVRSVSVPTNQIHFIHKAHLKEQQLISTISHNDREIKHVLFGPHIQFSHIAQKNSMKM